MKYSIVIKFLAMTLCAAMVLGAAAGGLGMFALSEAGLYERSFPEAKEAYLENAAGNYAGQMAEYYAAGELGGCNGPLLNRYYNYVWEYTYFQRNRVGYVLKDAEGNVLQEQEMGSAYTPEHTFTIPVSVTYPKVVTTMTEAEYYASQTEPTLPPEATVWEFPAVPCPVWGVEMGYSDGTGESHESEEPIGHLISAGEYLRFVTEDFVGLQMLEEKYPVYVRFWDKDGNTVYEASGDESCSPVEGYVISDRELEMDLRMGEVAEVPTDLPMAEGQIRDNIPDGGVDVLNFSITTPDSSTGVGSDKVGFLYRDADGTVNFRSAAPHIMPLPENPLVTGVRFTGADDKEYYAANDSDGVGWVYADEEGYVCFSTAMPAHLLQLTPEETEAAAEPTVAEAQALAVMAREQMNIYSLPHTSGDVVGVLQAGEETLVERQLTVEERLWGLTAEGWILMEQVTQIHAEEMAEEIPATAAGRVRVYPYPLAPEHSDTLPSGEAVTVLETALVLEQEWARLEMGWVLLEDLSFQTARTSLPEETVPDKAEEPTEETVSKSAEESYPMVVEETAVPAETALPENYRIYDYYDPEQEQQMVALCTTETAFGWTMEVSLAPGASIYNYEWDLMKILYDYRAYLVQVLLVSLLGLAVTVVYLCCAAGHRPGTKEVVPGGLCRMPLELWLLGGGCLLTLLVFLGMEGVPYLMGSNVNLALLFLGLDAYTFCLTVVGFCYAFAAQIKTPRLYWWRNSLCGRCLHLAGGLGKGLWTAGQKTVPWGKRFFRWLWKTLKRLCLALWTLTLWLLEMFKKGLKGLWQWTKRACLWLWLRFRRFYEQLPLTWQWLLTGFVMTMGLYICLRSYKVGWILMGFGMFFGVIMYGAHAFGNLLESVKHMADGDLESKVDDKFMVGAFREFAGKLNALADVAVVAAQKQLKSERMKTELITNVSHDIKTPLTSIINYVDLMEKPHSPEEQEVYLEVLSRQSQRLKKLIDDLMEMSKASTGNMTVEITRVDAVEAVNQSLGEFADKLEKAQLIPVFRHPEKEVAMMADGRLVWRVMSNLLGNAVKYAMPGTRLYLDLMEVEGKVILSIKNISRVELNVSADELMERFVRGDTSRNTEGSGLGLNIAQSLMDLQKGQLQLLVDGDLFKVTLIFPSV